MILSTMKTAIARWRIGHPALAPFSLHWTGTYAGHIDYFAGGRVRGWVYDAQRPQGILSVDLCVEGQSFARFDVDDYRADLAKVLGDHGLHGFSGRYEIEASSERGRRMSVRVTDRQSCVVGTVAAPLRQRPEADFPPEKWSCLMFGPIQENVRHKKKRRKA